MTQRKLDEEVLTKIIGCYKKSLKDNSSLGKEAKGKLLTGIIERNNFLSEDLQKIIDANRGRTPQAKYLLKHNEFYFAFKDYLNGSANKYLY